MVCHFEEMGGHITRESPFGHDPLAERGDRSAERNTRFQQSFPDFSPVFHSICNNDFSLFKECMNLYLRLTEELSHSE